VGKLPHRAYALFPTRSSLTAAHTEGPRRALFRKRWVATFGGLREIPIFAGTALSAAPPFQKSPAWRQAQALSFAPFFSQAACAAALNSGGPIEEMGVDRRTGKKPKILNRPVGGSSRKPPRGPVFEMVCNHAVAGKFPSCDPACSGGSHFRSPAWRDARVLFRSHFFSAACAGGAQSGPTKGDWVSDRAEKTAKPKGPRPSGRLPQKNGPF